MVNPLASFRAPPGRLGRGTKARVIIIELTSGRRMRAGVFGRVARRPSSKQSNNNNNNNNK